MTLNFWELSPIHPLARAIFALAVAAVWGVDEREKIVAVALAALAALFAVPLNPLRRPLPFAVGFVVLAVMVFTAYIASGNRVAEPVLLLGLKMFCLSASAIIAFSGLGVAGAVHAANLVWRPLAVLAGASICGSERIMRSFQELRDVQQSRGLRFHDAPSRWIAVLMFNWITYMVDLSGSIETQLATKWYGGSWFKVSNTRTFGRLLDWLLFGTGLAVVVYIAVG